MLTIRSCSTFYSAKKVTDIETIINIEAESINCWIKENCLLLNLKKGKKEFVLYGSKLKGKNCEIEVNHTRVNQAASYEYLGVTLDNHLNLTEPKVLKGLKL